jgi:SHS2 domain-containing protein
MDLSSLMGKYEFLPHTADEKFRVVGDSLEDAFATCVDAFYEIMIPKQRVKMMQSKEIRVSSKRLRSLLYDFLNELVFYFDDSDLILQHVDKLQITEEDGEYSLYAKLSGDKMYNYDVITEIKNMTYSDMIIRELSNSEQGLALGFEIIVVVDI